MLLTPVTSYAAPVDMTANSLRQAGWVQVSKTEHDEWHAGIPPYEYLRRLLYVVTYTFEKDGKNVTCTLSRDVMYDNFEQTCEKAD